jgi:hypothetical protein
MQAPEKFQRGALYAIVASSAYFVVQSGHPAVKMTRFWRFVESERGYEHI